MDASSLRRKLLKPVSRKADYDKNFVGAFVNRQQNEQNLASYNQSPYTTYINDNHQENQMNQMKIDYRITQEGKDAINFNHQDNYYNNNINNFSGIKLSENKYRMGEANRQGVYQQNYLKIIDEFQSMINKYSYNRNGITKNDIKQILQLLLGRQHYQTIVKTLKFLVSKQIYKDEARITISSEILISCLALIKQYNRNNLYRKLQNTFVTFNNINKSIFQYLKSKYPRNKGLSVPMGLEREFETINFFGLIQNDMLVNSRISFTQRDASRVEVFDKVKKFINLLLKEVDQHYNPFCELLNRAFKLKNKQQNILNQARDRSPQRNSSLNQHLHKKNPKIKMSRKLPETTQRFYEFGTQSFEISSPQLFRVMIKWIQGMQQLIVNPSMVINRQMGIKYIKKKLGIPELNDIFNLSNVYFDEIQSRRFEDIKIDIIDKILQFKNNIYDQEINQLIQKLNQFNDNLLKVLTIRSPKMKFIQQEHAEALKFSKYNSQFLEWLIMQKFLIIVKNLSQLSAYFQKKIFKQLDFINFNVFDLMRASFSGKKGQIIEVFDNLKQLQREDQLSVISIRSRFNTPLNDVMINFKMKKSFIVCELQLILVDSQEEGEEKLKFTQQIHHIIYELQRSPYGSMSEMALIMDNFDPTIFYQQKITFANDQLSQICRQNNQAHGQHQFIQIKSQVTPFVCAWCVKFYSRLANYFQYHKCIRCGLEKCRACTFQQNPTQEKRVYIKNLATCLYGLEDAEEYEQLKDDNFVDNFFTREQFNFIMDQYIKVRDHVDVERGAKVQSLQKLLHSQQKEFGLKVTEPIYCFLLKFSNGIAELKLIKYENYRVQICLQQNQEGLNDKNLNMLKQKQKNTKLERHDVLFFFKKYIYQNHKEGETSSFIQKLNLVDCSKNMYYLTNLCKKVVVQNRRIYRALHLVHRKKKFLIQLIKNRFRSQLKANEQQFIVQNQNNLEEVTRVILKTIDKCRGFKMQRHSFQLQNLEIIDSTLIEFLQREEKQQSKTYIKQKKQAWTHQVQVLNLSQNKITKPEKFLIKFPNLQQLYLPKNLLTSFSGQMGLKLKILDLSRNQIKKIPEQISNHLKKLCVLRISFNLVQKLPKLKLEQLEQFYLNNNKINGFEELFNSTLPLIEILDISYNSLSSKQQFDWSYFANFNRLRKLQAKKINLNSRPYIKSSITDSKMIESKNEGVEIKQKNKSQLNLSYTPRLEYLELSHNKLSTINSISERKMRQIKLSYCELKQIDNKFTNKLINLQRLQLQSNQICQFPTLLELPQLKYFKLNSNKIKSLANMKSCYLPKLKILQLQSNGMADIKQFEKVEFNSLKQLNLEYNHLECVPILNFPSLEVINLNYNRLTSVDLLQKACLPKLKYLHLKNNKLTKIPRVDFPSLIELNPMNNNIKNILQFSQSNIPKTAKILLYRNDLTEIKSELNFPCIFSLILFENNLLNVDGLSNSKLNLLRIISLNQNKISVLPILKLQNLQIFNASKNKLKEINQLNQWDTPKLRNIDLKYNNIKKLCPLKISSIQNLQISHNQLSDLSEFATDSNLPMLRKFIASSNKQMKKIGGNFSNFLRLQQISIVDCSLQNFDQFGLEITKLKNGHLKNLRIINFQYNQITHLPPTGSLNYLQSLEKLMLRHNKIKQMSYHLCGFKSLKQLYLSTNLIQNIQAQYFEQSVNIAQFTCSNSYFKSLSLPENLRLKSLTLNNCQINDEIIKGFYMPALKQLFLMRNQIQSLDFLIVPGSFVFLSKLYLQKNKITSIPPLNLRQLNELHLTENPLQDISGFLKSIFPVIKLIILKKKKKSSSQSKLKKTKKKESKKEENDENPLVGLTLVKKITTLPIQQSDSEQDNKEEDQKVSLEVAVKKQEQRAREQKIKQIAIELKKIYPNLLIKY